MTDQTIHPALTPEEWAKLDSPEYRSAILGALCARLKADHTGPMLIAILNAALPDSDPRKITREKIALIHEMYRMGCSCGVITADDMTSWDRLQAELPAFAAALESYLPPLAQPSE